MQFLRRLGLRLLNRQLTGPGKALLARVRAIAAGDYHATAALQDAGGEWAQLNRAVDVMALAIEQREARLRESEREYRALAEQMPAVIFTADIDPKRGDLYVSPYIETMFGWTPAEWLAEPARWITQVHPDDYEMVVATMNQLRATGGAVSYDHRMRRRDGSTIWVRNEVVRVDDEGGQPLFLQGVLLDITGRKRVDAAIRESEARYRALIETSPDAIMLTSIDDVVMLCNEQAVQLFGFEHMEEMRGKSVLALLRPKDRQREDDSGPAILEAGQIHNVEYTIIRQDGKRIPIEVSASLVQDAAGNAEAVVSVFRDISTRKRSEELVRAKEVAEQASLAKSEFLSRMSHELRTPLNSILGFGYVLQMDSSGLTDDQRESIGHIISSGQQLLKMINEVLDIARIETGHLDLTIEPVPVHEALQTAFDLIQPLASERDITVQVGQAVREDIYVLADEQRLVQILFNLLVNAIKYNVVGGRVTVNYQNSSERMRIEVIDTGKGLPQEKISRLFMPFDRLDAEYTTVEGTGLGLALVKRLVEDMHGSVGVDSIVGHGSTFWFELPSKEIAWQSPIFVKSIPSVA